MSDSIIATVTVVDPPITALDAEKLAGKGPSGEDIFRERIQVTGNQLAEISRVLRLPPDTFNYGLVVRPIGHADDSDRLDRILMCLERIEAHLSAMSDEHVTNENHDNGDES